MRTKERSRTLIAFNKYNARMRWAYEHPPVFETGKQWYNDAKTELKKCIQNNGANLTMYRAAGVASLLSPLTPWRRNIRSAKKMVELYSQRASYPTIFEVARNGTVYNKNAKKAVRYLFGDDRYKPSGMKTGPFHKNISGNLSPITVDSWMYRIVSRFGLSSETPTENAQRSIQRGVTMCSTLWDLQPAQCQAIIWTVERDYFSEKADRA